MFPGLLGKLREPRLDPLTLPHSFLHSLFSSPLFSRVSIHATVRDATVRKQEITPQQANAMHWHLVWKDFSKKGYIEYIKEVQK